MLPERDRSLRCFKRNFLFARGDAGQKDKSIPRFKGLWDEGSGLVARRVHSPPFQGGVAAPLIRRSRSLAAQTGWFVISNRIRRLRDFLLTTPAAARPPLL